MFKRVLLGTALFALCGISAPAFTVEKEKSAKETFQKVESEAVRNLKTSELSKVVKEAARVLQETQNALILLGQGKEKEALSLLKKVKVELAELVEKYGLIRLPVDVSFVDFDGVNDLETARKLAEKVKKAVESNDFVEARFLLGLLRNEIDITTTYMPLALYKQALELAVKLLEEGKRDAALLAVRSALGTLEVEVVIVPKPMLEAQLLIERAEALYKVKPEEALKFLRRAKYDVELTKVLGYLSNEKDVEPIVEKIDSLIKAIKEHAATAEEQFKEVSRSIKELRKEATSTR